MPGNAQCETCGTHALPAFSTERLCPDCKEVQRPALRAVLDSAGAPGVMRYLPERIDLPD